MNVGDGCFEVGLVSDVAIMVVGVPDWSGSIEVFVDGVGGVGFPAVDDGGETVFSGCSN